MRGMNVEQGREMAWNRNEWKRLVDGERCRGPKGFSLHLFSLRDGQMR